MPESENTHPCPVGGCNATEIPFERLMCARHWRMVPAELRRSLVFEWNRGHPRPVFLATRQRAIDAANRVVRK